MSQKDRILGASRLERPTQKERDISKPRGAYDDDHDDDAYSFSTSLFFLFLFLAHLLCGVFFSYCTVLLLSEHLVAILSFCLVRNACLLSFVSWLCFVAKTIIAWTA